HRLVLIQRFQDGAEVAERALACRRPLVHHRAVREVDEAHVWRGFRGRLRQHRPGRNHRVEQREAERGAETAEDRAAREVFSGEIHIGYSLPSTMLDLNAGAFTMPMTMDENR